MITKAQLALLYKYARKITKRSRDVDDVVQEALLLLARHPSDQVMSKKFLFTLIKRGWYHFYFDTNSKQLKYTDVLQDNYETNILRLEDPTDINHRIYLKQIRTKCLKLDQISNKQKKVLIKILDDGILNHGERAHLSNMKKQLQKYLGEL